MEKTAASAAAQAAPTASLPGGPAVAGRGGALQGYKPAPGVYDEMMLPSGDLRPHWRIFGSFLEQCSPSDIQARLDTVQRLLRDHGVTYNIYDDALGTSRPWALDLIPFIVPAHEAQSIGRGLAQRARLLDLILSDLYGPQRLLKDGRLPPTLVTANPGFLRPVVGVVPPGRRFLHVLGSDLVRTHDGGWRVLADRTQVPTGKGYTLENRIILSNVFPEEFNTSRVQRLASHFDLEREMLRSLGPGRRGGSTIVMLTPGPNNETYFEHAFKARYLGFPLVEGADLTVRDRRLYLKTLEGLRRVDVLVRRLDDMICDPLELGSDGGQGVPGMVEAWRSGSVGMANGLGTGLVETPALHPFLPGLCQHLLGEELQIPCVPTWWCGQKRELEMVLAAPEKWVLKEAFVRGARDPVFLGRLDAGALAATLERLKAEPHLWVAQEALTLSTAPTWVGDHLEPRSLVWRSFTLSNGRSYATMPGGLTRVSPQPDSWVVTMRSGGISKDTWVLTEGPVDQKTLLGAQTSVIHPARPPSAVPSRVADHLFWLGRYAERLEQMVRVLRTTLHRLSGEGSEIQSRELHGCLELMAEFGLLPRGQPAPAIRPALQDLLVNPKREGGVPQLLSSLRFNASAARDRLSDDTWRLFNRIERDARLSSSGSFVVSQVLGLLDTLVLDLAAFSGMQNENMTHGHGWRFLEIGRRIERALVITGLVRAGTLAVTSDDSILVPLLEICDSTMTYRRLHFARPQLVQVAYLLLQDEANPRSVAYQLMRLQEHVRGLPVDPARGSGETERGLVETIQRDLRAPDLPGWVQSQQRAMAELPDVCGRVTTDLESLSHVITEHYFSHAVRRVR